MGIPSEVLNAIVKNTIPNHPALPGRIFFFLTAILMTVPAFALQPGGPQLSLPREVLEKKESNVLTTGVRITNTEGTERSYELGISVPAGWRILMKPATFQLLPGGSETKLVSFALPPETQAGRYDVRITAKDKAAPNVESSAVLAVVIAPVLEIELRHLEAPRFVVAGVSYTSEFVLSNKGNVPVSIRLRSRNSNRFPASVDSSVLHFAPKEVRPVTVTVRTNGELGEKVPNIQQLTAQVVQDTTVSVQASSVVEVIPQASKAEVQYLEFPLQARLRGVTEGSQRGVQAEIAGSGSLFEDGRDRLEFLIRGPETRNLSVLGVQDEYRLRYEHGPVEVRLGDWNYSLSPLTEMGRYGFGGEGRFTLAGWTAGGFYNKTRYFAPAQEEAAGYLMYEVREGNRIGLNLLRKKERQESAIVSLRGQFEPISRTRLDLEYGRSFPDSLNDEAYAVGVTGTQGWVRYDVRYVRAGAHYTGYYRDLDMKSASLSFYPLPGVRFETYVRDEKRNLRQDTLLFYAPRDRYYDVGIGYSNLIAVSFRSGGQKDQLPNSKYDRKEDAVQVRLGTTFSALSLSANMDFGTTRDLRGGKTSPSERYSLFASAQPFEGQSYSASLEYSTGRSLFSDEEQRRFSGNVSAWVMLMRTTQFQMNLYVSRSMTSVSQVYGLADATLEHLFPSNNHTVTARARYNYASPAIPRETAFSLEYAVPIAIPLKRRSSTGQLEGRVVDENGRGLSNILLTMGEAAAITDRSGGFLFPSVKPGTDFLLVDKATVGLDKITVQPMPMEVRMYGGEERQVRINVTSSARLTGTIILFGYDERSILDSTSSELKERGGKAGVFLELTNGTEIHRRVSDGRGSFAFADLRPGNWRLRVAGGEIPQFHSFDRDSVDLTLLPGEKEELALRLIPRRRPVRIVQQGPMIQAEPSTQERGAVQVPQSASPQTSESFCLVYYDGSKGGYLLQVSSWVTKSKALRRARAAMDLTGARSFVEQAEIPGLGTRYRVRVGVFKTQEEADGVCLKLRQYGPD